MLQQNSFFFIVWCGAGDWTLVLFVVPTVISGPAQMIDNCKYMGHLIRVPFFSLPFHMVHDLNRKTFFFFFFFLDKYFRFILQSPLNQSQGLHYIILVSLVKPKSQHQKSTQAMLLTEFQLLFNYLTFKWKSEMSQFCHCHSSATLVSVLALQRRYGSLFSRVENV